MNLKEAPAAKATGKGTKRTIEQATGATSATAPAQAAAPDVIAAEASAPEASAPDTSAPQAAPEEASQGAAPQAAAEGASPEAEESKPMADAGGSSFQEATSTNDLEQQPGIAAQAAQAASSVIQAGSDAVQSAVQVGKVCCAKACCC